eukprot:4582657-Pleurochrysis_carterae.AAC.4
MARSNSRRLHTNHAVELVLHQVSKSSQDELDLLAAILRARGTEPPLLSIATDCIRVSWASG